MFVGSSVPTPLPLATTPEYTPVALASGVGQTISSPYVRRVLTMPEVHVVSRNRFAGVDINKFNVCVERNTLLAISNVGADQFAVNVCERASGGG